MSDRAPLTYDSDRLIREWRDRYTTRRSVQWQMLDQAEVLVRDAIAREREQEQRHATAERDYDLERREREAQRAQDRHEHQVDRLRRQLAEAESKIATLSPRMTLMREERETVEDGTVVRLLAPTVPSYGDGTSVRPWMLGELEDVVHRLRMGGADEGTEVRFKRDAIEACVPFAEFALTPASPRAPAPSTGTGDVSVWSSQRRSALAIAVAALVLVLVVVLGSVVL